MLLSLSVYLLLEVLSTQKGQETKPICDRLSNCSVWFFALSYCHPFQRGRREVTGHGQMRVEREENGGMREEEDMAVVTDGRGRDRLVEGSMTDQSEGWRRGN